MCVCQTQAELRPWLHPDLSMHTSEEEKWVLSLLTNLWQTMIRLGSNALGKAWRVLGPWLVNKRMDSLPSDWVAKTIHLVYSGELLATENWQGKLARRFQEAI